MSAPVQILATSTPGRRPAGALRTAAEGPGVILLLGQGLVLWKPEMGAQEVNLYTGLIGLATSYLAGVARNFAHLYPESRLTAMLRVLRLVPMGGS